MYSGMILDRSPSHDFMETYLFVISGGSDINRGEELEIKRRPLDGARRKNLDIWRLSDQLLSLKWPPDGVEVKLMLKFDPTAKFSLSAAG